MVEKIVRLLYKEIRGLHEAAYLLGLFAVFSQLLALIRDRLLASSFGAGEVLDIYYASFRIPDLIFVSVASLVSFSVLIPFLAEKINITPEHGKEFVKQVFSAFFFLILVVSAVIFIFTPFLVKTFLPGLISSDMYSELITMTRIMLLQPILLGLSGIFASVTQYYGRFILYAVSPLLYNIGIIAGLLFLYPVIGIVGLAYGVVLGAVLHLLIQLPFLARIKFLSLPTLRVRLAEIQSVVLLSLPRTLGLSANQIALLFLVAFASLMPEGSITVFNFSFTLQAVPLSIIAVSYSVAAFPTLARLFSKGQQQEFFDRVMVAARHIVFWTLPASILFIVLRAQIVRTILGAGAFDWADTRLTAAALALFVVSLTAQGLTMLFVRGYYAAGNTRKPLLINLFSASLVVFFAFGFVKLFENSFVWQFFIESLFRVEDLSGTAVLMLPLGYSLAVFINAILFWIMFQRDFRRFSKVLGDTLFQSLAAGIVMGFVAHRFLNIFDDLVDINTFLGIFTQGLLSGFLGITAGIVLLRLLKNREIHEVWESLHRKFWKTKTIAPEQEV